MTNQYEEDGYLLIRNVISQKDLKPLINCIEKAVDIFIKKLFLQKEIDQTYENFSFEKRLSMINKQKKISYRTWDNPIFGPELFKLIHHKSIIKVLEPYLGPNFSFNGDYHLRPKMPDSKYTAFPFHNDSQYYEKLSEYSKIITVWIPLVDVDENNGCLKIIPGSNHWEWINSSRDKYFNMRSDEDVQKRKKSIPLPMKVGDIVIFSNHTFHGSGINHTSKVRWSIDLRYCRTRNFYEASEKEKFSEDYMYEKLKQSGRIPMVVKGLGPKWTFKEWKNQIKLNNNLN